VLYLAYRSGLLSPTLFVQQVNTLSVLLEGRICLNMIAGFSPEEQAYYGDYLNHDERYERANEFLTVCQGLWEKPKGADFSGKYFKIVNGQLNTPFYNPMTGEGRPEIYLSGNSQVAQGTAIALSDCYLRYGDTPEKIAPKIVAILAAGKRVGLRLSLVARATREEAVAHAQGLVKDYDPNWKEFIKGFVQRSDSVAVKSTYKLHEDRPSGWLNEYLWTGAVPFRGGPAVAMVGSYDEVATAILEFKAIGVGEMILSGWPTKEELMIFDRKVLPRVRLLEEQGRLQHAQSVG
jgi:alkanesulfonate monooxygenase